MPDKPSINVDGNCVSSDENLRNDEEFDASAKHNLILPVHDVSASFCSKIKHASQSRMLSN